MGRLIGLELHNFKSYRGTSTIGFGSSYFTSIIGPNGAGKSNMMDAISFVLGIKSSQLRSQNVKDLIYRGRIDAARQGTEEEEEEEEDDDNDAQEDLTADISESANAPATKAWVSCIYEKDDGVKLTLQRVINANGNSEYKINGKAVTALQYSTLLKRENILIKARNFLVFQGDVEAIASQSPKDLTNLIETISGSIEYAKEYDELNEKREAAHQETNNVFSRKRVLNSESKQYKEQMLEQEAFTKKLTEKHDLIKLINLYKLYHNEKRHKEHITGLESEKQKLQERKLALKLEENNLKQKMSEYSKDQLKLKKITTKINKFGQELDSKRRDVIPLESQKKLVTGKINNCRSKVKDIQRDVTKQQVKVKAIEKQLRDAKKLYDNFLTQITSSSSGSGSKTDVVAVVQEYESLRDSFLSEGGSQLEDSIALLLNEKESISITISNYEKQIANSSSKIESLESLVEDDLSLKLSSATLEINDLLTTKKEKESLKSEILKEMEKCKYRELQINTELRDVLIRIDELSSQQRESQKQRKLRENVSMLKKHFPQNSIKGLVYDLVRPSQHKYDIALSTLLGRNFDSIIVESTAVAYKCVEIFKERRSGVATFIPIDMVNDQLNLAYLRSFNEGVTPGMDIIEYDDSSLEPAIQYIVGDSLVCDNMELARNLKWGGREEVSVGRIISLDGSIIHKSGLMTGGVTEKRISSNQTGSTWDRNEWKQLNEHKDELLSQLSTINETKPREITVKQLVDEIEKLDDDLPLLRNQKQSIERVIEDRKKEIEHHQNSIKELTQTIANKKKLITDKVDKKLLETNLEIKQLQNTIYKEFCLKYSFEGGIQDYEDLHGSALRSRTKEKSQFLKAITTLTSKLEFETERLNDSESRVTKITGQLKEYEDSLLENMNDIELLQSDIDKLEAEVEVLQEDQAEQTKQSSEKLKFIKTIESNVEEIQTSIGEHTKRMGSLQESLLMTDSERLNTLKNCKIENINIPLKDGELEKLSIEGGDSETAYSVDVDYSSVGTKLKESGWSIKVDAELRAKLDQTHADLELLTPNAKAVERLKGVETKLKEFDRDFNKARQRENKILEKFNTIKTKRYELFMEAFTHILDQIDNTYKELTKSSISTLGGSAYLTLEDEDEPYLTGIKYHAMPPMKRFRDMDLLSGGEKTIAALALLFAIHSFQPSPFFVLDEVDAALDNSNVAKIANYIRKHAGPHFQFIVISLKNSLFEKSDALVGIYRDQVENSSRTVTLDLREYLETAATQTQEIEA